MVPKARDMTLKRLLRCILYAGGFRFRKYERDVLSSVCEHLPETDAACLCRQIAAVSLIQREIRRRMVLVFFLDPPLPEPLPGKIGEQCIAMIKLRVRGQFVRCSVISYDGMLSSLEFDKPPRRDWPSALEIVSTLTYPDACVSISKAIDDEEHCSDD